MSPSPVHNLSAAIVPHRLWPTLKWFYASTLWYYHQRADDHQIRLNGKFFQLVDPLLREVCRILNEANLQTTPSCQGHFYPRDRFEKIWAELSAEQDQIRSGGLLMKDSESDLPYLFHDPDYQLPWRDFNEFYAQAAAHQGTGYLGIVIPANRHDLIERFCESAVRESTHQFTHDAQLSHQLDAVVFSVLVDAPDPESRDVAWRDITERVRSIICPLGLADCKRRDPAEQSHAAHDA